MNKVDSLAFARELCQQERYDQAHNIAAKWLTEDPNDLDALFLMTYILWKSYKLGVAYNLAKQYVQARPDEPSGLLNLGAICDALYLQDEARKAYTKALGIVKDPQFKVQILNNICALLVSGGQYEEGEFYGQKAIALSNGHPKALGNIGFCQLARKQWVPGWQNYHHAIGQYWRKKKVYGAEPEWDGSANKSVVIYGEQGIGDEICFASMLQPAIDISAKVILDCHEKLEGLFARSFPQAHVYGTKCITSDLPWAAEDREFDASFAIGQLGEFFRSSDDSFPREPFLVADPDRVTMWKALFASKGKPCIGIAWSGGIPITGSKHRQVALEDFLPLFKAVDAHWVCLQYKPASSEIDDFLAEHPEVDLVEYPYATLTDDYDDTAGMVAALDAVLSVPTAVVHLAGALGVPTVMMKAKYSCWKTSSGLPFHPLHAMVEWQGSWKASVESSITHIEDICSAHSSDTTQDSLSRPTLHAQALNGVRPSPSALPA